ncbi:MAG: 3-deoxy-8-phosphooctulonate synthase [Magnetococcales bacterium]|nr:3-deoxy-8-phosphooctulonate synthase [Magnetococcales bacterium]NGZ27705.1 3-deoxy-8-phosphooctulonate synthase [Magnetococcales bacterium]
MVDNHSISVGSLRFGNALPLVIIAGPCVIEGEAFALQTADFLARLAQKLGIGLVYKSSFDKANRTSLSGYRGPGMQEGLAILEKVKATTGLPIITDVHTPEQVQPVSQVADMLQTPAFLCRQTDFIQTVAAAGKPVNIKKGQFLAPADMAKVAEKAAATGNRDILLCERGFSFGYNNLVVDMRGLAIMAATGYPVVFDATHSVQAPGGLGHASGGEARFAPLLARSAVAAGVAAVFIETHPDPIRAPCDGPNMIPFHQLEALLTTLQRVDAIVKQEQDSLSITSR